MRARSTSGIAGILSALLAAASLGAPAAAAPAVPRQVAPTPTITVTPSSDLLDGQTVLVTGSGFSTDVTSVALAAAAVVDIIDLGTAPASGGSFSASVTVPRWIGSTDCANPGNTGGCVIAAGNNDGGAGEGEEIAIQPVTFLDVDTVSAAPGILRNATAASGSATVSWTPPSHNGGTPITGYKVTPYIGFWPTPARTFASAATTQTITGLTNGTTYRFRVQAINAVGTSGFSKVTNPVTPTA